MKVFTVRKGMPVRVVSTLTPGPVTLSSLVPERNEQLSRGVAVSALPSAFQKRLQNGESVSIQELEGLNLNIVK